MKIAAINGSPKLGNSNSKKVISMVQDMLRGDAEWVVVTPIEVERRQLILDMSSIVEADVLLFAFPLYVDGIQASLLRFMMHYVAKLKENRPKRSQRLFAIANCGFYEGIQNESALQMMACFCETAGIDWCGGVGIGTGEMISALMKTSPQSPIRKPVTQALRDIADAIAAGASGKLDENIYTQHAIPWFFYKLLSELGWRQMIKKSGLATRDLDQQPLAAPIEG
jgi:multimeric flavodoxin WrbA